MSAFSVQAVPGDQICTLILSGEADLAVADDILDLGTTSLAAPSTLTLVIDLAQITFIDSTVLGVLVRLNNLAQAAHKSLQLTRVPARVSRVLELAGLAPYFDVRADGR